MRQFLFSVVVLSLVLIVACTEKSQGQSDGVKILTIVDVQNDFVEGGALAVSGGLAIVPIINEIVNSGVYDILIATQDWHPEDHISFASTYGGEPYTQIMLTNALGLEEEIDIWPNHCVADTFGAALVEDLVKQDQYIIIKKGVDPSDEGYSGFSLLHKDAIDNALSRKEALTLDFVGIATDYCVFTTSRDAAEYVESVNASEFVDINVLLYACAAIDPNSVSSLFEEVPLVNLKR